MQAEQLIQPPRTSNIIAYLKRGTSTTISSSSSSTVMTRCLEFRDSSKKATLQRSLIERLNNSKNMVLIIGPTTRFDTDWVPFEIGYAVDRCKIPIIATYTGYDCILNPIQLTPLWPPALAHRIGNSTVRAIHIPFKQRAIDEAIRQFDHNNLPTSPLSYYTAEAHRSLGIPVPEAY